MPRFFYAEGTKKMNIEHRTSNIECLMGKMKKQKWSFKGDMAAERRKKHKIKFQGL